MCSSKHAILRIMVTDDSLQRAQFVSNLKNDDFRSKLFDFLGNDDAFLLKNDDFLLKSDDFLLKSDDFLLKSDEFTIKMVTVV